MDDLATWRGSTGRTYQYWVLPIETKFESVDGNYIFAKRNFVGGWDAIYVGQGDFSSRADVGRHHKGQFILEKGATHVHVRQNPSLLDRMTEWADILDFHSEALEPSGCNGSALTSNEGLFA